MKYETYWDYLAWIKTVEERTDLTDEEKQKIIDSEYKECGGILELPLLPAK